MATERQQLDTLAGRQSELENEVTAARDRVAVIEKRMYSGEVSASRDLQAMADEVAGLRGRVSRLEDVELEVMEEREPVDALVVQLGAELAARTDRISHIEDELRHAEADLVAEEAAHAERRAALAASVPPELMERYERLRSRLGGVGVARLVNGACGGCHLALPATELDRLRKAPDDAVVTCEQCGRILVRG